MTHQETNWFIKIHFKHPNIQSTLWPVYTMRFLDLICTSLERSWLTNTNTVQFVGPISLPPSPPRKGRN